MTHFIGIWLSPRATIRNLVDGDAVRYLLPLAAIGGIEQSLSQVVKHSVDETTMTVGPSTLEILGVNIVVGAIWGVSIFFFLLPSLVRVSGKLFKANAENKPLRISLCWGMVPQVPSLALTILFFLVVGEDLAYFSQSDLTSGAGGGIGQAVGVLSLLSATVFGVWSLGILLAGLSEVFGVSKLKSFFILIMGCLPLGLLFLMSVWAFSVL